MNDYQKACIGFISVCFLLCAITQAVGSFMCLSVALILFGFVLWLDRNKSDRILDLEARISKISERVELQSLRARS